MGKKYLKVVISQEEGMLVIITLHWLVKKKSSI